jgi:hypothetical protein
LHYRLILIKLINNKKKEVTIMKKMLGCFLCVLLLVFGIAFSVQAVPVSPGSEYLIDPTGSTPVFSAPETPLPYIDGSLWTGYGTGYLGGSADLYDAGWATSDSPGQDNAVNVNSLLAWSGNASLTGISQVDWNGIDKAGTIDVSSFDFISLKWDGVFGLWDVRGVDSFGYDGLNWGLSHYSGVNVPVPAAIYLLGAGFVGLAGLRKKYKK